MATVNDIVAALQPQPQSVAVPPLGTLAATPMSDADQAAMSPETFANPAVTHAIGSLMTLPRRAIENSQNSLDTGNYDPGPTLEAAMLPMGTGAIAGVPVRAGEAILGAGPIRAYHGSPHDFDAFSMDKIGSGEGAQAYGHGLYFADQEAVAKQYRDTLGGDTLITPKGTVFDPMSLEHLNVRSRAHSNGSNLDATIDTAQKIAESDSPVADMAKRDLDKLLALKAEGGVTRNKGSMYEVNINADPEHFLDWDKPLSEQHPTVQAAATQLAGDRMNQLLEAQKPYGITSPYETLTGSELYHGLANPIAEGKLLPNAPSDIPIQHIQAQALRDAGIPGIKYLDQGSRAAGDGSRNYVLFDDKMVDIMRKYGMGSVAALPPAALLAAGGSEQKQ